ncbi:MAG TPA: LamG domain-containing protein [Candidatus Paceibacterota bacterium]|nr:LamG domain-containing protein [Candidatus Paceibacterota bacterium]
MDFGFSAPLPAARRGFTLFYAVLTASLLLAIGIAIFNITYKELILSSGARESSNAFYAADTGLECALYWDLRHAGLSAPAFGFYGDSLASGLMGYWRFEDDTGSLVAVDSSGGGNVGALNNMDANTAWVGGRIGGGIAFDGINDYIDLTDGPGLNFASDQDFSISFWFRSSESVGMIVSFRSSSAGNPVIDIGLGSVGAGTNNGQIKTLIRDDAGGGYAAVTGAVANDGLWQHVVVTRTSGGRVTLYLNGDSQGANTSVGADGPITTNLKAIGSEQRWVQDNYDTPDARYFAGVVDDVRVYNRALSATEIQRLSQLQSNLMLVPPVVQNSNARCLGTDITDPASGWDSSSGWDVSTTPTSASTTFDILLPDGRCATVEVVKNTSTTTIISRGYSSCDLNDQRRVERAIRAKY